MDRSPIGGLARADPRRGGRRAVLGDNGPLGPERRAAAVAAGLGFSALGVTWVIDAYALTFGGLLLLGGKAADRFGRKRVLLLGLGVFGLASLAGGLAQDPSGLVVARAVQGIGAGHWRRPRWPC